MSNNNDWESGYTGSGSGYGPEWEMGRLDRERNNNINLEIAKSRAQLKNQSDVGLGSGSRGSSRRSSDTMVWISSALLLASMAGVAAHNWWAFAATIVAFAILTFAAQKFFATPAGQKVAEIIRYLIFVATIAGVLVCSFMQWSWQGLKWSAIIMTALAAFSGLHYFFTETESGGKAGKIISYLSVAVIAIIFIYAVITD